MVRNRTFGISRVGPQCPAPPPPAKVMPRAETLRIHTSPRLTSWEPIEVVVSLLRCRRQADARASACQGYHQSEPARKPRSPRRVPRPLLPHDGAQSPFPGPLTHRPGVLGGLETLKQDQVLSQNNEERECSVLPKLGAAGPS